MIMIMMAMMMMMIIFQLSCILSLSLFSRTVVRMCVGVFVITQLHMAWKMEILFYKEHKNISHSHTLRFCIYIFVW